jgi:hypothetical protein
MPPIPAEALIPTAFGSSKPDWHWKPSDVPKGGFERLYLCSEFIPGWRYYTMNRQVRLSKDYPANYAEDVGYKYGHGPDKGPDKQERGQPTSYWLARCWHVERQRMVAAIFDSKNVQTGIQKAFTNTEFQMLDHGITNFYLSIFHEKEPSSPALTYSATANLRVLRNMTAAEEVGKPWYPDRFFQGLNPLEAPSQPPGAAAPHLPATVRDENGAEEEVQLHGTDDGIEW